jgi:hypothetical protein
LDVYAVDGNISNFPSPYSFGEYAELAQIQESALIAKDLQEDLIERLGREPEIK